MTLLLHGILTTLLLCTTLIAASQSFSTQWGGPLAYDGIGIWPSAGGWTVAVRAYEGRETGHRAALASFNSAGNFMGEQEIPVQGRVFLQGAAAIDGGGAFLFGSVIPPGANYHHPLLVRISSMNTVEWYVMPDLGTSVLLLGAVSLPDGGAAVCGTMSNSNGKDVLVARFDPAGDLIWHHVGQLDLDDEGYGIALDGAHLMVTGRQSNFGGGADALFMRISMDGILEWTTSWGGAGTEVGYGILRTGDGHFLMAGSSSSFGPTNPQGQRRSNLHLIKLNVNGDTLWTRTFGTAVLDNPALNIALAANGDALLCGEKGAAGISNAYVARVSPTGDLLWERQYVSGGDGKLLHVHPHADGFITTGWTFGPDPRRVLIERRNAQGD